jgi:hypothetical protein
MHNAVAPDDHLFARFVFGARGGDPNPILRQCERAPGEPEQTHAEQRRMLELEGTRSAHGYHAPSYYLAKNTVFHGVNGAATTGEEGRFAAIACTHGVAAERLIIVRTIPWIHLHEGNTR